MFSGRDEISYAVGKMESGVRIRFGISIAQLDVAIDDRTHDISLATARLWL